MRTGYRFSSFTILEHSRGGSKSIIRPAREKRAHIRTRRVDMSKQLAHVIRYRKPHTLRHTYASLLIQKGNRYPVKEGRMSESSGQMAEKTARVYYRQG